MIKGVTHAHLGPIWYHSELSDVPYFPNQFLGWDFFWRFLQQEGSSSGYCFCIREAMYFFGKNRILSVFTLLPVGLHYHKLHEQRQISDIHLIDILPHHLYQFMYTECTLATASLRSCGYSKNKELCMKKIHYTTMIL